MLFAESNIRQFLREVSLAACELASRWRLGMDRCDMATSTKRNPQPLDDVDRFAGAFSRRGVSENVPPAAQRQQGASRSRAVAHRSHRVRTSLLVMSILVAIVFVLIQAGVIELDRVRAAILRHIVAVCPDQAGAYKYLNKHYNATGRPREAVDACEKLVAMRPEDPCAVVLLGDAYGDENRPEEAITSYQKAITLDPNSFNAHFGLGKAYSALGRYVEAIDSYHHALKIQPGSAAAHMSLGLALSSAGRYEEAMQAFQQAKQIDPMINEVQVISGNSYLEAGLYRQAIACYRDAITIDQNHARAYYNLGKAYLEIGDRGLAIEQQHILESLDPGLADQLGRLINN